MQKNGNVVTYVLFFQIFYNPRGRIALDAIKSAKASNNQTRRTRGFHCDSKPRRRCKRARLLQRLSLRCYDFLDGYSPAGLRSRDWEVQVACRWFRGCREEPRVLVVCALQSKCLQILQSWMKHLPLHLPSQGRAPSASWHFPIALHRTPSLSGGGRAAQYTLLEYFHNPVACT